MQLEDYLSILSKQQTKSQLKSTSTSKSITKPSSSTSSSSYAIRLSFLQPLIVISLDTVQLSLSLSELTVNLQSSPSSISSSLDGIENNIIIPTTKLLSMELVEGSIHLTDRDIEQFTLTNLTFFFTFKQSSSSSSTIITIIPLLEMEMTIQSIHCSVHPAIMQCIPHAMQALQECKQKGQTLMALPLITHFTSSSSVNDNDHHHHDTAKDDNETTSMSVNQYHPDDQDVRPNNETINDNTSSLQRPHIHASITALQATFTLLSSSSLSLFSLEIGNFQSTCILHDDIEVNLSLGDFQLRTPHVQLLRHIPPSTTTTITTTNSSNANANANATCTSNAVTPVASGGMEEGNPGPLLVISLKNRVLLVDIVRLIITLPSSLPELLIAFKNDWPCFFTSSSSSTSSTSSTPPSSSSSSSLLSTSSQGSSSSSSSTTTTSLLVDHIKSLLQEKHTMELNIVDFSIILYDIPSSTSSSTSTKEANNDISLSSSSTQPIYGGVHTCTINTNANVKVWMQGLRIQECDIQLFGMTFSLATSYNGQCRQ